MGMSQFRRSVKADTKRTGGKGRRGNYYERWRVPQVNASPFVLINADYIDPNPAPEEIETDPATGRPIEVKKPYYKRRVHKRVITLQGGKKRVFESTCSAGFNPHAPQPCAGCNAIDQGDKTMGVSDVAVFGIVHLATYHRHPIVDRKTGGFVVKQNPQQGQSDLFMVDDECVGRTCNFCRILAGQPIIQDPQAREPFPNYRAQDIQTFFGKKRYLELGKNHLQHLMGWDATISSLCGNDGAQLITDGFACPHCNTLVIDMGQDPRTDEQIMEAVSQPYPCMRCQRPVLLKEIISCEVCEQNNRQPAQYSIMGRVLWGVRQGEDTASQLVLHRHESLQEFGARVPPQMLPQGKTFEQVVTELSAPYDFASTFAPKSVSDQMKELELIGTQGPVPGAMPGYQQAPQGYQQPPQQYQPQPGMAPAYQQPHIQSPIPGPQYQQPAAPQAQPGPLPPPPMPHPHFGNR
jgi:hypothetical protein